MYQQIDSNKRNSTILIAAFFGVIAAVGYMYGYVTDTGYSGLVLALIVSAVWTLISWYGGASIVLSTSGAQEVTEKDQLPSLWNTVENLSITAGLPMPRIHVIEDDSPNAFATGRDPKNAHIAVTTGLLRRLNQTELEGVLAHELSHIGNYDIRIMMLTAALAGCLTLLGDWIFHGALLGGRKRDGEGNGNGILMIVGIVFILISPIVGEIIKLAISRRREFLADASGALLTRYPEGLASALEKISAAAVPMAQTSVATNHLWIADPKAPSFGERVSGLFSTHPPVQDRIAALRDMTR